MDTKGNRINRIYFFDIRKAIEQSVERKDAILARPARDLHQDPLRMSLLKSINAVVTFLLELGMLASLGYFGFHTGKGTAMRWLLGLGLPLIAMVLWGIFAAPNSGRRLEPNRRIAFALVVFGVAAFALYRAGQMTWALVFGGIAMVNQLLAFIWKQ